MDSLLRMHGIRRVLRSAVSSRSLRIRYRVRKYIAINARLVNRKASDWRFSDAAIDKLVTVDPLHVAAYQDEVIDHPGIVPYGSSRTWPKLLGGSERDEYVLANAGRVVGGDWDQQCIPIEDAEMYRLLHDRFIKGMHWDEIPVFQSFMDTVLHGNRVWHSRSTAELRRRADYVDALFESISKCGCSKDPGHHNPLDAITLNVGRDGALIFSSTGAHHRFMLARLLGLGAVQARILIRHELWQQRREAFRRGFFSDAKTGESACLLEAYHPDLQDLVSRAGANDESKRRWR